MPKKKTNSNGKPKQQQQQQRRPNKNANRNRNRKLSSSFTYTAPLARTTRRGTYFDVSSEKNGRYSESIRIRGQDFLGTVTGAGELPGTMLLNFPISPQNGAFIDTRLNKFSELYDKFRFNDLTFHYEPACPATTIGSLVLAYDRDPSDVTPPASVHGIQQYFGMMGSQSGVTWSPISVSGIHSDPQEFYYGNHVAEVSDERLTAQGQLYIAAVTTLPVGVLGNLWAEYDVSLFDPQLEDTDSAIKATVGPQATTTNAKEAFNGLAAGAVEGPGIIQLLDGAGDTFYRFAPGFYELTSSWSGAGGALLPTFLPYVGGLLNAALLTSSVSVSATSGIKNAFLSTPKGCDLYSTWSAAWPAVSQQFRAYSVHADVIPVAA